MQEKLASRFYTMYTETNLITKGEKDMDTKTKGIVATIVAVILCGCPGLFLCIFGAVTATGNMPYTTELNGVSNSGTMPAGAGIAMLCFSLIFILIPIAVGFFMLRKKPEVTAEVPSNESLPPTS
jgi:hypothetical protein